MFSRLQLTTTRVNWAHDVSSMLTNSLQHLVRSLEVCNQHADLVIIGSPGQESAHFPLHALHRAVR